jgi:hypothetical protein
VQSAQQTSHSPDRAPSRASSATQRVALDEALQRRPKQRRPVGCRGRVVRPTGASRNPAREPTIACRRRRSADTNGVCSGTSAPGAEPPCRSRRPARLHGWQNASAEVVTLGCAARADRAPKPCTCALRRIESPTCEQACTRRVSNSQAVFRPSNRVSRTGTLRQTRDERRSPEDISR